MILDSSIYYNYDRVFSYNSLLNIIIGERGVGKSYGLKKHCIKNFLKTGHQFIYLRRYETEIKKLMKRDKFFEDIKNDDELKHLDLKCSGNTFLVNGKVAGYSIPLSKSSTYKSDPFPKVGIIMFDEFLINNNTYHYLENEPIQLMEFIETIGRLRDIKIFLLGNNTTIVNPYFDYFNITLPYNSDIKTFKDGLILVQYIKNEKYRRAKKESKFGKLVTGTRYGDYAIDNKSLLDNDLFKDKKSSNSKYFCTINVNNTLYGVWNDYTSSKMYINKQVDSNCPIVLAFNFKDHNEKTILLTSKSVFYKNIYLHYSRGLLYFDSDKTKYDITKIILKIKK